MSMVYQCLWYLHFYGVSMSMVPLCLWCINVYGAFMSMVCQCLWYLCVYGVSMSMVPSCLWCINVYGTSMSMVHQCLWYIRVYSTSMSMLISQALIMLCYHVIVKALFYLSQVGSGCYEFVTFQFLFLETFVETLYIFLFFENGSVTDLRSGCIIAFGLFHFSTFDCIPSAILWIVSELRKVDCTCH